ncbi:ER membrane protein complex subunit 3 isoform X1 [Lampetra planeri]
MAEPELLLDSNIRVWVVLPIVLITFLVGIIRHYVSHLLHSDKKVELEQVSDSQVLLRSRILREHGKYIPRQSFINRKHYFNDTETGFFKKTKRKTIPKNPMTDPSMLTDMMKGNFTNVLPMIVIGGWINWTFSGFVTTKVPFPLTLRFKPMLQRGIELVSLDASWVSSASWYFLNVFGLRSMYSLILGQDNGTLPPFSRTTRTPLLTRPGSCRSRCLVLPWLCPLTPTRHSRPNGRPWRSRSTSGCWRLWRRSSWPRTWCWTDSSVKSESPSCSKTRPARTPSRRAQTFHTRHSGWATPWVVTLKRFISFIYSTSINAHFSCGITREQQMLK